MPVKVGDVVTWRHGLSSRPPGSRSEPLGICNCEVLALGTAAGSGAPAAKLKLPPPFRNNGGSAIEANALTADLEKH